MCAKGPMTSEDSPVAINIRTHSAWRAINMESRPKIRLGSSFEVRALHFDKIKKQHTFFPKGQHTHIVTAESKTIGHGTAEYGVGSVTRQTNIISIP